MWWGYDDANDFIAGSNDHDFFRPASYGQCTVNISAFLRLAVGRSVWRNALGEKTEMAGDASTLWLGYQAEKCVSWHLFGHFLLFRHCFVRIFLAKLLL
ncbi:hypothetical protein [Brevibacillus massiliensis]|nr:hypothetical protein [Brevibacillus massiliensis]